MYTMTITAPEDVSVYTITSTATILQNTFSTNTALTTNYSFTLTVQNDCVNSVITDKTIIAMANAVSATFVSQDIAFLDSIATFHSNPAYCGPRTYTLSHAFLTISGTTMKLYTANLADVNVYTSTITVSLTNYPMVTPLTKSF